MRRVLPFALLLLAPAAMLYTVWQDPYSAHEDDIVYFEPVRRLVGDSLAEGHWPMANPFEATGTALMGDPQSAVLYPPTWLFAVADTKTAYAVSILLAFALAGLGTFLYLRRLDLLPAAALFGALAFQFGGFMVGHRVHLGMIHTAAFLPWGLWCIEGLRRRPGARGAALWLVAVLYLAISSGHWPALVHMTLVWGAYFLLRARPFAPALGYALGAGALALLLAAPQLQASFDLIGQATRARLGYALAGENSFLPPAAILGFFPFLMGSRADNLFAGSWWGPSHFCEVLGYVGLATLALATASALRMYRKPSDSPMTPVVRTWTWIVLGAALFMLGYWLPTYRLIHMLPVLGVVRCPARMVLAADLGLAVLAAIGVHVVLSAEPGERTERLRRSIGRIVTVALPVTMVLILLIVALGAWLLPDAWAEQMPWPMGGGTDDMRDAVRPTNPAVFVPLGLALLTIVVVRGWLARPRRRVVWLLGLLVLDLFVLTRFVDVPDGERRAYDPQASPAAERLRPEGGVPGWRVWGLSPSYHHRPAELLLPKAAHALGIPTINSYGPFQSSAHVHLFELRIWGGSRSWEQLVRRNHLLSLYGVRYLLAVEPTYQRAIESVRTPDGPRPPDGDELLTGDWSCTDAEARDGVLHFRAPTLWPPSDAEQVVSLAPATWYRIAFEARGPEGGPAHFVRAEIREDLLGPVDFDDDPHALIAYPDQMSEDWRRFEWVFRTPEAMPDPVTFRVWSMSERPVEVRGVSLRDSRPDEPHVPAGRLAPGAAVYERVADLPALLPGDAPVRVYENQLWEPLGRTTVDATPAQIEALKWAPEPWLADPARPLPDVSFSVPAPPTGALLLATLPALVLYGLLVLAAGRRRRPHP